MALKKRSVIFCILVILSVQFSTRIFSATKIINTVNAPRNIPAEINWDGNLLTLKYNDKLIVEARLDNVDEAIKYNAVVEQHDGKTNQVIKWTSRSQKLKLIGDIYASEEAFPCESDKRADALAIVRHSFGLSHSLLNRAVYDRKFDWVLSVDFPATVEITPDNETDDQHSFQIVITSYDIILRFRPLFYQQHRGLSFYEPWTYHVWKHPVVGWCSWFAFFQNVTEADIKKTADVLADVLVPFGFEYLQIDDGYQQEPAGLPETWLKPNKKFPSGMNGLSDYITQKGLKPGVWTYTSFHQKDFAEKNKKYFVLDENGNSAYGKWIGYVLDGSNPETISDIIKPIYRGFKKMDWKYFKVDALRHLRYEGYNSFADYFEQKNLDRVEVYRDVVKAIREEIGDDSFMLGCWGIRPELIGIIDGCRIGTDGYGYAGLAQYNSFNNVIWRNDPDHIELSREEAYRSSMVTSLTGSLFMLTDKSEVYKTDLVEPAKRSAPVLFTMPGQIYDVDPSRSIHLDRVDTEVSGSGPRIFDADQKSDHHLFLLEINKPFESWMMLGRTGGVAHPIRFKDLGLAEDKEYLVFEFWSKRFIGSFNIDLNPGEIDPQYNCQLFCIRERKNHPQVLATNRHVSCGGYELENVKWEKNTLMGESEIVGRDTYALYLTEPQDYELQEFLCDGVDIIGNKKSGIIRIIELRSNESKKVSWAVKYK